jgi:hypothetical protein
MSFFIGDDMTVAVDGLHDCYSEEYLNAATISAQLKDSDGDALGSPGSIAYVDDSDGDYVGIVDAAATALMSENSLYHLDITITQGDYNGFRRIKDMAKYHGKTP